jgi:tRNA/tmRNA/rRNA uracil-C5-methylase (TrmA/RlmC/RlmD family)
LRISRRKRARPRRIIDLYCGAGTFALFFAKAGARVVGIEENPHAVREAQSSTRPSTASKKGPLS